MLRVTVHRGAAQIGGCATEIATASTRVIIDMGAELETEGRAGAPLRIEGVTHGAPACDAVLLTHTHGDHVGEMGNALPGIPLYLGAAGREILAAYYRRVGHPHLPRVLAAKPLTAWVPLRIGDIRVTPFVVDHSAFDAQMLLLEAGGKRILHTGDFRAHGYKGKGLRKVLQNHVGRVDLLVAEGTCLSRPADAALPENRLQAEAAAVMARYKYVAVVCASTNIDRIAAFYAATPRGRYFLCDGYQREILETAQRHGGAHTPLYRFPKALVYGDNLLPKMRERGFCMLVRGAAALERLTQQFGGPEMLAVYSLWKGYLQAPGSPMARALAQGPWRHLHTSGHADAETLRDVCACTRPARTVFIHKQADARPEHMLPGVPVLNLRDGQPLYL